MRKEPKKCVFAYCIRIKKIHEKDYLLILVCMSNKFVFLQHKIQKMKIYITTCQKRPFWHLIFKAELPKFLKFPHYSVLTWEMLEVSRKPPYHFKGLGIEVI